MPEPISIGRRLAAEAVGTALLLAAVVGSGIMGERLAAGNVAIALLANTVATGAALVALILAFGSVSGAHFNPAVTLVEAWRRGILWRHVPGYIGAQLTGAFTGVGLAHAMFGEPVYAISTHVRSAGLERVHRDVRPHRSNLGYGARAFPGDAFRRGCLHHRGLLVHRIHLVRESGRNARAFPHQYFLRNSSSRRAWIHRRTACGSGDGSPLPLLAST